MPLSAIRQATAEMAADVVRFAQDLARTPATSGEEGALAALVIGEMRRLRYDEVFADAMGNVVGRLRGQGDGPVLMLNCHLDHVDPGRRELWEYDPYGAIIEDGWLYGRGVCDVKAAIASQVYGAASLRRAGLLHRGDILVTGTVLEECGEAFGMRHLCDVTLKEAGLLPDYVVLGEPTGLNISLGHRGRVELEVQTYGRTSHGSSPWRGVNAVYLMMPVIERVQALALVLPSDDFLGQASIALTIIGCSPGRLSIIPDVCTVSLDRRFLPSETVEETVAQVQAILDDLARREPGFKANVRVRDVEERTYTGAGGPTPKLLVPWRAASDHPLVTTAQEALGDLGRPPEFIRWDFGTDGSHTAGVLGIPTIGYAPGEEEYAHVPNERVRLDYVQEAVAGNAALALALVGQL